MNLYKINKILSDYVDKTSQVEIPDVYKLYLKLGEKCMGRKVYRYEDLDNKSLQKDWFNKSIKHKSRDIFKSTYIGKPQQYYYAEDIVKNIRREMRVICVHGEINISQFDEYSQLIKKEFNIDNFVMDLFEVDSGDIFLMEVNELHLASIDSDELKFILSQILLGDINQIEANKSSRK